MALDRTKVLQVAPEFTALGAKIDPFVEDAALQLDATALGRFYDLAGANLVAHTLTISFPQNAAPGMPQSESMGGVSRVNEVVTTMSPSALQRTKYGREFVRLLRVCGLGIQVA